MDPLKTIESLLRHTIGLHVSSIGPDALDRALRQRMRACGAAETSDYLQRIRASSEELKELFELLVVPETWFFRDAEPFVFLKQYVVSQWLPRHKGQVLRILSIPCSTGEEPYSTAMALLDAGINRSRFSIDAVDVSARALQEAGAGLYGRNSFRGDDLSFRDRHFHPEGGRYRIHEAVRKSVRFLWGNLADPAFLTDHPPYHVVLCRNLLIYFDPEARDRAFQTLTRLLEPSGVLFLGHAETLLAPSPPFIPVNHPRAFALRRADKGDAASPGRGGFAGNRSPAMSTTGMGLKTAAKVPPQATPPPRSQTLPEEASSAEQTPGEKTPLLDRAAALADMGRLPEARRLCEEAMAQHGATGRGYLLLGLISESEGDTEAAEASFNKAVYLNPDFHEAIVHLALLSERKGDVHSAALFRQRARRIEEAEHRDG